MPLYIVTFIKFQWMICALLQKVCGVWDLSLHFVYRCEMVLHKTLFIEKCHKFFSHLSGSLKLSPPTETKVLTPFKLSLSSKSSQRLPSALKAILWLNAASVKCFVFKIYHILRTTAAQQLHIIKYYVGPLLMSEVWSLV